MNSVIVSKHPLCDFCKEKFNEIKATYDGVTTYGKWAYMCEYHFELYGIGLGLGIGQKLIKKEDQV